MSSQSPSPTGVQSQKSSLWPLLGLLVLVNMAATLYTLPLNRVIELRICQDHYEKHGGSPIAPDGTISEKLCKIDEVQRRLAAIQGIMETVTVLCDLFVTIPFTFIAERFGVKVVLWCNLVPRIFMSFWAVVVGHSEHILPTKAIIAGPILAILGGDCVFQSTIFTLTSALSKEYVERASYFSYISSTTYVVNFIGPSLAAFTMSRNLWLPFFLNITLLCFAIPTINMLPGPRAFTIHTESEEIDEAGPLLADQDANLNRFSNAYEIRAGYAQDITHAVKKLTRSVTGRRNFQILLLSFFLTALASSDTKLLVQYISKRFDVTFAQAGYMLSAKAIVNFTLLTVIVPRIIRASMSSKSIHGSEVRSNYICAQISIAISVIGVLAVGTAFHFWMLLVALVLYALGSALPVFTMSLVKSPLIAIADSDIQDFSIVILVKTLGSLVGAPFMAFTWVQAIRIGGAGLGLPYFVSAGVYLAAVVVVAQLKF
ncbi:major facilitator superfamily domain-containing protein [Dendryphion nanum]|uniref:Major facilitator superfamily domain-containing protein n=1 Tax=Dendryphion nanum TaxID=256645 RepID=A0A9P9IQ05_9PLEO|nr:major facilitator superfamily domain-containing protein [Dendryphion nanum]